MCQCVFAQISMKNTYHSKHPQIDGKCICLITAQLAICGQYHDCETATLPCKPEADREAFGSDVEREAVISLQQQLSVPEIELLLRWEHAWSKRRVHSGILFTSFYQTAAPAPLEILK